MMDLEVLVGTHSCEGTQISKLVGGESQLGSSCKKKQAVVVFGEKVFTKAKTPSIPAMGLMSVHSPNGTEAVAFTLASGNQHQQNQHSTTMHTRTRMSVPLHSSVL
jgi:hypothetical protein